MNIPPDIAASIKAEILHAHSILLHCHPSPDPDSVGSALGAKYIIEQIWKKEGLMDKKVTVIAGDSIIPQAFMHFPGASEIIAKNFFEIDAKEFDLFIILDSSLDGVSRLRKMDKEKDIPSSMKIINIDHHRTNSGAGFINFIDPTYPATCLMLYAFAKEWGIEFDENISSNLFIGTYTDTGAFKFEGVGPSTFSAAAELSSHIPDLAGLIAKMQNSTTPGFIAFEAIALNNIQIFHNGILAIAAVPHALITQAIIEKKMTIEDVGQSEISGFLRMVPEWNIVACAAEAEPGMTKISFRSADSRKFDVSKLAAELGGGGHKAAAGARIALPMEEALKKVVETAEKLYNL